MVEGESVGLNDGSDRTFELLGTIDLGQMEYR